jgi:hypothetical protein
MHCLRDGEITSDAFTTAKTHILNVKREQEENANLELASTSPQKKTVTLVPL